MMQKELMIQGFSIPIYVLKKVVAGQSPMDRKAWENFKSFISTSREDDCICVTIDEAPLLSHEDQTLILNGILSSAAIGAKMFLPALKDFGQAIPLSNTVTWIDSFGFAPIIFMFRPLFKLSVFKELDNCDSITEALNLITSQKLCLSTLPDRYSMDPGFVKSTERIIMLRNIQKKFKNEPDKIN